ncbi:MAG: sugar phosphate isomerase/epimerase [Clostridiales bacterium]|nr:sugar phosphate isomerase/epimerase [Clostridiales bacterium]
MLYGVCSGPENIELIKASGYDFIEGNLTKICQWTEEELKEVKKRLEAADLPMYCSNCFFPGNIKLLDESATSPAEALDYVKKAFERADYLGIQTPAFGSGNSRRIPEGMEPAEVHERLLKVLQMMGDVAKEHNITMVIEPLSHEVAETIFTVGEALSYARELGHPNVKVLADTYHMFIEKESYDVFSECSDFLKNIHFSNPNPPNCRFFPHDVNEFDYKPIVDQVKAAGYNGKISIEARLIDADVDIPLAVKVMKQLFD